MITKTKQIGIWMDHSAAHLMVLTSGTMETKIIESKFTHTAKEQTLHKSEKGMHQKEEHTQLAYYKEIAAVIMQYEEALIFGPTDAKEELLNMLRADHHFDKIDIEIRHADKMTVNQEHAFVRTFFFKHLSIIK